MQRIECGCGHGFYPGPMLCGYCGRLASMLPLTSTREVQMREQIEIGSAPHGEPCAQLGEEGFDYKCRKEIEVFKNQIIRMCKAQGKEIPEGVRLRRNSNRHEFGIYYELVVDFSADNEEEEQFAYWLDGNVPEFWDDEAKKELTS